MEAIEDAARIAAGARTEVQGRLRVNVDETIGQYLLSPHMDRFLKQYPAVSVEISAQDHMGDLIAEGFDIAIRFGPAHHASLICRLLLKTPVITCASPEYLARHGHPHHPSDLQKGHHCLLHRDPATGRHFPWDFIRERKSVQADVTGQLMVNTGSLLVETCVGGYGIAQVLQLYMKDFLADDRLIQVLPDWAEETYPALCVLSLCKADDRQGSSVPGLRYVPRLTESTCAARMATFKRFARQDLTRRKRFVRVAL